MLYGPLVAVIRLFIVLIQLQRSCQILKHFTHFVSELQRFQSRLFHKCPITIDGNRQCTWQNSTLCTSPLCHLPWLAISESVSQRTHFQFFISTHKVVPTFFCAVYWNVFECLSGEFFAFCLVWSGLVWARLVCTGTLALVLVTGLGHCLLPFPVRGAAYANIFNMIAFLYFDFMRSLCCVFPSLQGVGGGRGPQHVTNII